LVGNFVREKNLANPHISHIFSSARFISLKIQLESLMERKGDYHLHQRMISWRPADILSFASAMIIALFEKINKHTPG